MWMSVRSSPGSAPTRVGTRMAVSSAPARPGSGCSRMGAPAAVRPRNASRSVGWERDKPHKGSGSTCHCFLWKKMNFFFFQFPIFWHCRAVVSDQSVFVVTDVDECSESTAVCTQLCTNTPGSFLCGCRAGFTLDEDLSACRGEALVHSCATWFCLSSQTSLQMRPC